MGLRSAINDKCRDCIYDSAQPGNWRQQVTWCRVTGCPLYPVRPMSSSEREAPKNGQNGASLTPDD